MADKIPLDCGSEAIVDADRAVYEDKRGRGVSRA